MFWAKESHEDGFIEDVSNRESIGVVDAAVWKTLQPASNDVEDSRSEAR